MPWNVILAESVIEDLRWFGRKEGRKILQEAERLLAGNPLEESRNMKTLRPNPFARRELRLFGKYRVLFNVHEDLQVVTIVAVGEKRGNVLLVQGEEFEEHREGYYEGNSTK